MENSRFSSRYCAEIAQTAWQQICCTTAAPVVMSWGVSHVGAGIVKSDDGNEMPCLIMHVSGLLHTGLVIVALDEAMDVYDIQLRDNDGTPTGDWVRGLYFDEIGEKIDELVERSPNMTDEGYAYLAIKDSERKMQSQEK